MINELSTSTRSIQIAESPIRKLAPLAYATEDQGVKIYRLNIGKPDLPTPQKTLDVLKNVNRAILEYSHLQGYRMIGIGRLLRALPNQIA